MSWPLFREALLVCLFAWLCAIAGLSPASAQEPASEQKPASERGDDYLVGDMPEWLGDYGYEDTHDDGSVARGAGARGSRPCNCLGCRDRLTGDWFGARTRLEDSGVGVYYTGISDQFGPLPRAIFGPRPGWGVEVFYNAQITPWMSLTPDFQIVEPEAGAIANTSYIGGIRLNLKF